MHLKEMQAAIDGWIQNTSKGYFAPLTNLGVLTEEVGEMARIMVRTYGEQNFKRDEGSAGVHTALADEMADVLWVLGCLANQCGVDLEDAFAKNLKKKETRDKGRH